MFTPRMSDKSNASRASKNSYKNLKKFKDVAVESVDSLKKKPKLADKKVPGLLLGERISAIQFAESARLANGNINLESARHPL